MLEIIGVGSAKHSWSDAKTIKPGKKDSIISDGHEKHSIVYTFVCIE